MGLTQIEFRIDGEYKLETLTKNVIMRLRQFCPPEGYYFADGLGKDSTATRNLLIKSGVPFDAHYQRTGIDPPELVYYGREHHPDTIVEKPEITMWEGIYIHGLPLRQLRWCCEELKETGGHGRTVVTGIRWAESARRSKRLMVEICKQDVTKRFLHPIIDFTTKDVWDYIHQNNLPYCKLYDEGFKRLGCILCPMETPKQTQFELTRFPKFAELWKRAAYRYWEKGTECVKKYKTPEDFWQWWLSRKGEPKVNKAQCTMFG
jgi:phosphoadenosine phosphosulfate reductase